MINCYIFLGLITGYVILTLVIGLWICRNELRSQDSGSDVGLRDWREDKRIRDELFKER